MEELTLLKERYIERIEKEILISLKLDARENETLKLNEIIRLLMEENTYLKSHVEKKTQ